MKLITVMFGCNDEHGSFEGCARSVEVENVIDLAAVSLARPPRIAFIPFEGLIRLVRISGRMFPVRTYRNYVANVSHAAVQMELPVAAALLNFLKEKSAYNAEGGAIPASNAWSAEPSHRFTVEALEAACHRVRTASVFAESFLDGCVLRTNGVGNVSRTKGPQNVSGGRATRRASKAHQNALARTAGAGKGDGCPN